MFLDRVKIFCKAGNGGNGKVYFRREKFVPCGGPEGGDGGNGGNVVFKVDKNMSNLSFFRFSKHFKAENGVDGGNNNCNGKCGEDLIIKVPRGTVVKNAKNDKVLADLSDDNDEFIVLKGGKGGRGNSKFATPTRQAPTFSELGVKTEEFEILLELKTIADVGLVGFPNVGKSTLLASVSNAKPKIANYHFTTLAPNIGVVNAYNNTSFVMADIPGLIEGASEGAGLGLHFLRHIERTRLLIHVIDISESEGRNAFEDYEIINNELKKYGESVSNIPQIIALNKIDLCENAKEKVEKFKKKIKNKYPVYEISAAAYIGLDDLMKAVVEKLKTLPAKEKMQVEEYGIDKRPDLTFEVIKVKPNYYEVVGTLVDEIARGVIVSDYASFAYFQKRIKDEGIVDELLNKGVKEGDTVKFSDIEFEYVE